MKPTLIAGLLSLLSALASAQPQLPAELDSRRRALDGLLKEQWEYTLRTSPEFASIIGDKRYNDRLSDYSQAFIDADLRTTADFLKRFEAQSAKVIVRTGEQAQVDTRIIQP